MKLSGGVTTLLSTVLLTGQLAQAKLDLDFHFNPSTQQHLENTFVMASGSFFGNEVFFRPANIIVNKENQSIIMEIKKENYSDKSYTGAQLVLKKFNGDLSLGNADIPENFESVLYGKFEATIKAACGVGVVSAFYLFRANPWKEIDIEFLGKHPNMVQTSYIYNGDFSRSWDPSNYHPKWNNLEFNTCGNFNKYTIDWQPGKLIFSVNDIVVDERRNEWGHQIPDEPLNVFLNLWLNGSPDWAGPIDPELTSTKMEVKDVKFIRYK